MTPAAAGRITPAARRGALRTLLTRLPAPGVDALLVTDLVDIRYLTGFTGSNAALLVHLDGDAATRFCTDGRYRSQAGVEVPDLQPVIDRACALALAAMAPALGVRRLGFASDHVTVDAHSALAAAAGDVRLVRTPGLVGGLRAIKDDGEIATLRAACAAADAAFADLVRRGGLRAGRTELDVLADLEAGLREHGADGPSFDTIVAAGAHSAVPHHRPTRTPLAEGDLLKMDFGAVLDGYHSDMTRTVVLGRAAAWQREVHELVAAAQAAGRAALAPGADVVAVDAAARRVITDAGYGEHFPHGLGHGVGLAIHEPPLLAATATGTLAAGMAVTVEPGVYLDGRGGVRIEDVLVVRDGGPELLTCATAALLEV